MSAPQRLPRFNPYLVALAAVAAALGLALAVEPFAGVANVYLVFLTAVIGVAVRYGLGPSLVGSLLSVLACNFFFLPPLYTLAIAEPANIVTLGLFFVVALATSNLAARARDEALAARQRAETTEALYDFSRRIAGTVALPELLDGVVRQIETMLPLRASLLLPDGRGGYESRQGSGPVPPIESFEQSALRAAYPPDAVPAAGRSSLRLGDRLFLPLLTTHGVIGLAGLVADPRRALPGPGRPAAARSFAGPGRARDRAHAPGRASRQGATGDRDRTPALRHPGLAVARPEDARWPRSWAPSRRCAATRTCTTRRRARSSRRPSRRRPSA